jgi:hypothetical protein
MLNKFLGRNVAGIDIDTPVLAEQPNAIWLFRVCGVQ